MVTYGLIVTRSGKIIKENRKDSKIINQQIVSKLTIVLVQQFTIWIDDQNRTHILYWAVFRGRKVTKNVSLTEERVS